METETKKDTFEIRDNRGCKRFFIDDLFDDTYAAITGPYGYAIYCSLCRRADKKQKAWPGVDVMAKRLRISRQSVFAGLEILEFLNIIKRDRIGKKCTNRYTLLATGNWRKDWTVMYASLTSSEVRLKYFSSTPDVLQVYASLTSIERLHKKGCTVKDIATNVADCSFSSKEENAKCKKEGCKNDVEKGKEYCKICLPMDLKQFIAWCTESNQPHIHIIRDWAETVEPNFRTQGQWTGYISRNAKIAVLLIPYDRDQMEEGYRKLELDITGDKKFMTTYGLESLFKKITGENAK